jgi:hypothetical protein
MPESVVINFDSAIPKVGNLQSDFLHVLERQSFHHDIGRCPAHGGFSRPKISALGCYNPQFAKKAFPE